MKNEIDWKEEAWEALFSKKWDKRSKGLKVVEYTKKDLAPILEKYTRSGQGEIRIFHSSSQKVKAVKKRGVMKIPLSRNSWVLVKKPPALQLTKPRDEKRFKPIRPFTEGMLKGLEVGFDTEANPGETTLLAVAKHIGIVEDFYGLEAGGVTFTGGRQSARGAVFTYGGKKLDLSKSQIEIDGAYEWDKHAVIAEVKSSLVQEDFDVNQVLIPLIKWRKLLGDKKTHVMVLLSIVDEKRNLIYHVYDLDLDEKTSPFAMKIIKSKKYVIPIA